MTIKLNKNDKEQVINISYQLMTRAEPPKMVQATIKALLDIKAPNDEVLLIDNNHTDKTLYEPLQAFCDSLDTNLNVRFFHEDHIEGYKAGALNYALKVMDKSCDYIVVVDSDYQALPWARRDIATAIEKYPDHALIQFPQYYRDICKPDIHGELNHYFSYHLNKPNNRKRALSTGTFAVINRAQLIKLGGWSGASITEDAQMGVLMHLKGAKTQYIDKVIATGVLPCNLADLIAQRRRWIYGNMQVLTSYTKIARTHGSGSNHDLSITKTDEIAVSNKQALDRRYIRAHLSQLSAWVNFTGPFIIAQLIAVVTLMALLVFNGLPIGLDSVNLDGLGSRVSVLSGLIASTLWVLTLCYVAYFVFLGRRLVSYLLDDTPLKAQDSQIQAPNDSNNENITPLKARIRAWLVHMSFWELGALSWLPVLWGRKKPFLCTPKLANEADANKAWKMTLLVMPKLLLVLNLLTVILVAPYSTTLMVLALAVVTVKLLSILVMLDNFKPLEKAQPLEKFQSTLLPSLPKPSLALGSMSITSAAANDTMLDDIDVQESSDKKFANHKDKVSSQSLTNKMLKGHKEDLHKGHLLHLNDHKQIKSKALNIMANNADIQMKLVGTDILHIKKSDYDDLQPKKLPVKQSVINDKEHLNTTMS